MLALASFLLIILISVTIIRVGAIALELTGLSAEIAAFQAQSAFTGTGFTTSEAEQIVMHPVRRNIVKVLMLFGSAGLTSSIATLIITFTGHHEEAETGYMVIGLIAGLVLIYFIFKSQIIYRGTKKIIVNILKKNPKLLLQDYQELLGLEKGFVISKITVENDSWLVNKRLIDLKLDREGSLILAIERKNKSFVGAPSGHTQINEGDKVTVYGREKNCISLANRKIEGGDADHGETLCRPKIRD